MNSKLVRKVARANETRIVDAGDTVPLAPRSDYLRTVGLPLGIGVATTFALLSTLTAVAENNNRSDVFKQRVYLGLSAGISDLDPESRTPALTVGDDRGTGGSITLGYDLSRRFAVEGYYANLGEATIDFLGDEVGSVDYQTYGLNLLGYVFNGRGEQGMRSREGLSGFLKIGVGGLSNDSELDYDQDYSAHVSFGGGLEYGWANGLGARAELTSYDTDAHFLSVGLVKRFGRASTGRNLSRDNTPAQPVETPIASVVTDQNTVEPQPVTDLPKAYFAFDKAALTSLARDNLDLILVQLDADPRLLLTIEGHADATGPEAYNLGLSKRRAEAAKQYLVDNGVDASRITTEAFGERVPDATNANRQGRALNRRVQFILE